MSGDLFWRDLGGRRYRGIAYEKGRYRLQSVGGGQYHLQEYNGLPGRDSRVRILATVSGTDEADQWIADRRHG